MAKKGGIRGAIKRVFVPERTAQEKIALKLTKQGYMCQAFYIAMGLALVIAFVKMFILKKPVGDYIGEEIIFFVPLFYFAVRHSSTNLKNIKKINIEGAMSVLVLVSIITAVLAAVLSFAALFSVAILQGVQFYFPGALIICASGGILTGVLLYLILSLLMKKKKPADSPTANKLENKAEKINAAEEANTQKQPLQ